MLVKDGNTIVLGGLLNARKAKISSRIPLVGRIPGIGALFGKTTWTDDKSEIVILITPHIVGPTPSPYMQEKIAAARKHWAKLQQMGLLERAEKLSRKEKRIKRREERSKEAKLETL